MIFLGTPHRGINDSSSLGTQGQIYKIILAANLRMEVNLLQTMYQDNDVLMKAVDRFTRLINNTQQHSPRLYCFYEQKGSPIGNIIDLPDHPKVRNTADVTGHMALYLVANDGLVVIRVCCELLLRDNPWTWTPRVLFGPLQHEQVRGKL